MSYLYLDFDTINERRDNLVSYIEHRYGQDIEVI